MIPPFSRLVRDRMEGLTASLSLLRERVRHAVAGELAKAVGEALRDLLNAVLVRNRLPLVAETTHPPVSSTVPTSRWDDDEDEYCPEEPRRVTPPVERTPLVNSPVQALRTGVSLTTWLLQHKVPLFAGLGLGLAAALASLSSHPLVQTGLAVAAAAAELLAITESLSSP